MKIGTLISLAENLGILSKITFKNPKTSYWISRANNVLQKEYEFYNQENTKILADARENYYEKDSEGQFKILEIKDDKGEVINRRYVIKEGKTEQEADLSYMEKKNALNDLDIDFNLSKLSTVGEDEDTVAIINDFNNLLEPEIILKK